MLLTYLGWQACATMPSYCLKWGLANFFCRLALNHDPPYLHCGITGVSYCAESLFSSLCIRPCNICLSVLRIFHLMSLSFNQVVTNDKVSFFF
jgi:hypothetical protein